MKKNLLLVVLLLIAFGAQPVQAYNPPPAMNLMALMTPRIQIKLPPMIIAVPDRLIFAGTTYIFHADLIPSFTTGVPYLGHKISVSVADPGTIPYYVISITGWKVNEAPPLKDFRMTFKTPISRGNIVWLEGLLRSFGNRDTAFLSGPNCEAGTSHICLKTITTVRAFGISLLAANLLQAIPIKGVFVEGNTAASGTLANFILSPKALAVGGAISIQGGGKLLAPYNINVTPIGWPTAGQIITSQSAKRAAGTEYRTNGAGNYNGALWNLNSNSADPRDVTSDSFSTPPEGKLWNVIGNPGSLTFNNATQFKGSGTIAVGGDLVINGDLTCEPTTRLGFLVSGNITVNAKVINCGAFVALGNTGITLNVPLPSKQGTYKVIYISAKDIKLPDPSNLTGPYTINYDSYFAKNPTALFSEILSIVFGS